MSLVGGFNSQHHFSQPSTSFSYTSHCTSTDVDEDLISLLSSDSFSLQSGRDRDLDLLQALLQSSLPAGSSPTTSHAQQHPGAGQWVGQPSSGTCPSPWNGWAPSNSTSFHQSQSHTDAFHSGAGVATPFGTPLQSTIALPSSPPSQPFATLSSQQTPSQQNYEAEWNRRDVGGYRAPAASRERERLGRPRQCSDAAVLPTTLRANGRKTRWDVGPTVAAEDQMMED
ncbi:hypothetical protein P7C70_g7733, partial [Phenoliferia sp. Uapishka_3]